MEKKRLLQKIFKKKEIKDYTYAILFFSISSFFLIFAIRPALTIALSLKRESSDLRRVNDLYERNILKLVEIQSTLESIRDKTPLLQGAIPEKPETNVLISDITNAAKISGLNVKNFQLASISLKKTASQNELKHIKVQLQSNSNFQSTDGFIEALMQQRRLKTIKRLQIIKEKATETASGQLKVIIDFEGYYL